MLVKDLMTADPICGHPNMPITEVQALMSENNIRHIPIVDEENALVGLITQRSLFSALRTDESTLSQFEVSYILAKIQAHHVMVEDVITIDEEVPIEEAARIMADKRIGCMPVMKDNDLIGIITDNDLFNIMLNLLGARRHGIRMTILQPDRAGEVARLSRVIDEKGGYFSVFATAPTSDPDTWVSIVKVTNVPQEELVEAVNSLEGDQIEDVREV